MSEANNTPKIVGGVVIAAVIVVGLLFFVIGSDDSTTSSNSTVSTSESQAQQIETDTDINSSDAENASAIDFADGSYSAETIYASPGGNDGIGAEIVLVNNQIESLEITRDESNNTSIRWVDRFVAEVFDVVEGQDLNEADVDKLGGASLTSAAFNDLLDDIRNQAQES